MLKAGTAGAIGLFAVMLSRHAAGTLAGRRLSAFLSLIVVNQGLEAIRALELAPDVELVLHRAATIAAALDPIFLLAFAGALAHRPPGAAERVVAVLGCVLAASALFVTPAHAGGLAGGAFVLAWAVYTAGVYAFAAWQVRGVALREGTPGLGIMHVAFAIVTVPAFARIADATWLVGSALRIETPYWLPLVIAVLAAAAFAVGPRSARPLLACAAALGALAALFTYVLAAQRLVTELTGAPAVLFGPWHALGATVRWLAFGSLVSVGVVRDGVVTMNAAGRRRCARVLVAAHAFVLGVAALLLARDAAGVDPLADRPSDALLLAAALLMSQSFRGFVDGVAARAYGVTPRETAETASPTEALAPGRLVGGRYRIERVLGRGSSGRTFLAHDGWLDRPVAIKSIPLPMSAAEAGLAEARAAAAVRHPRVVTVYDVQARPSSVLIVMEYVAGGTLLDRLASGVLPRADAARVLRDVAEALEATHIRGIVHADVKPSNVLLRDDGTGVLADFGVARAAAATWNGARAGRYGPVGTPEFMAPEVRMGAPPTAAADVHALGVLVAKTMPAPRGRALARFVAVATDVEPARRYADGGQARRALEAALSGIAEDEERTADAYDVAAPESVA